MPITGGGSGSQIPVGPSSPNPNFGTWPISALPPATYARMIGYTEAAFYGVAKDGDPQYACRNIWTKPERDDLEHYLMEAQESLETILTYKLTPTWLIDESPAKDILLTRWGKVIQLGAALTATVTTSAGVNHTADPATIGPIPVTFSDPAEVKVYYPGTTQAIEPLTVQIVSGELTIWIPRVRMVSTDKLDNPPTGLDYTDASNFQQTVDIARLYNDPTKTVELIQQRQDETGISLFTSTAQGILENAQIGRVHVALTATPDLTKGRITTTRLYYQAGLPVGNRQAQDMIIRLAHSRMPQEPKSCERALLIWKRDRNVPQILTRERYNCPFGLSDGAWIAWTFVQNNLMLRAGGWH